MPRPRKYTRPSVTQAERSAAAIAQDLSTVTQRVVATSQRVASIPDGETIFATDRPDITFGGGPEPKPWLHAGDGSTTTFAIPGRLATSAHRYVVTVGGVKQTPAVAYDIAPSADEIVFAAPPPAGEPIVIYAPFYGTASDA